MTVKNINEAWAKVEEVVKIKGDCTMSIYILLDVGSCFNAEGRLGEYGGHMGFDIDMSTVSFTMDAKTNAPCYIAYARYNKDSTFWWIASHTKDMQNCFAVCLEGSDLRLKCDHIKGFLQPVKGFYGGYFSRIHETII